MQTRFGRFTFDRSRRQLLRDGAQVHVSPKAFALLGLLLERAPAAVSKDDIIRSVWPDVSVSDASLTNVVTELRGALGDSARQPRFIRTVHGFGYAFCGDVSGRSAPATTWRVSYAGRRYALRPGDNLIGRDADAAVLLDEIAVSRRHARISIEANDGVTIEDLGSRNGTFVNGRAVHAVTPLRRGDVIGIGPVTLVLERTAEGSTRTL